MSTRELLKRLATERRCLFSESYFDVDETYEQVRTEFDQIKAELAKRPHVPGRPEAKKNRQKASKIYRGKGKSKDR